MSLSEARTASTAELVRYRDPGTGLSAWIQLPDEETSQGKPNRSLPPLVVVHGVGRNRRSQFETFAPICRKLGIVLIAPRFSRSRFRGYQRCEVSPCGIAPDRALTEVLTYAGALAATRDRQRGETNQRPRVFGFSGGAQFAHRFILRGGQVDRLAICAPGYFTMPDPQVEYPYGTRNGDGTAVDPSRLARIPTCVLVGSKDTERDRDLRTGDRLDRQQGHTRLERAHRFVIAMRAYSCAQGLLPTATLSILEGGHHSFASCIEAGLAHRVVQFLYPETVVSEVVTAPAAVEKLATETMP